MSKEQLKYEYEIYIAAPIEDVWKGLTDGDLTRQYVYGTRMQSTLKKGSPYAFVGDGDFRVVDGQILDAKPNSEGEQVCAHQRFVTRSRYYRDQLDALGVAARRAIVARLVDGPHQRSYESLMTTTRFLRIASIISLVFTTGHTLGGRHEWSPMGDNDVLRAMTTVRFDTLGVNRSYLDFFMGVGWSISVAMLLQTVLPWQLALLARSDPARLRPIIGAFALASAASGLMAWRFISPVPALFSCAVLLPIVAAFIVAGGARGVATTTTSKRQIATLQQVRGGSGACRIGALPQDGRWTI